MVAPDPERWKLVEDLFFGALDVPAPDRGQWLREQCGNDSALMSQVEAMLAADATAAGKLDGAVKAAEDAARKTEISAAPSSQVGRRLGQYILVREIGRGAGSTLYEAGRTDGQHRRPVTIKMLSRGVDDEDGIRNFRAERLVLARLDHPAIIRLLDSGTTEDGRPFLITDYADGIPVTRFCRETAISEAGKLGIFADICDAVRHVHERKVVLRGLKPANILVSPEGKPKLVDFSAASWTDPEVAPRGTFAADYTSPEVLRGEAGSVQSDVYSLGAIFYEMLTGRRAAAGELRDAGALNLVIAKAMHPEPARRYASVGDMAASVRNSLRRQAGAREPGWRWAGVAAASAIGVGLLLWAGISWWNRAAGRGNVNSVAVLPFVNLGTGVNEETIADGLTEDIIAALARGKDLKVPSRTTVWQYRNRAVDTREVGRKLGVTAVLEGSVRRSGDQVRIAAQLIGVDDGFHLWAGSFDRKADHALEMQREVAAMLTRDLTQRLVRSTSATVRGRAEPDSAAQRAFLAGYTSFKTEAIRNEWTRGGASASLQAAIRSFERATQLDPQFSGGWAGLGEVTEFAASIDARNRQSYRDKAEAAALKALELEPTNPLALATLGNVYMAHDWKLGKAEPYLRRAVEASPHSTGIYADYANLLASLGRYPDAVELLQRSALLEPGSPRPAGRLAVLAALRGDAAAARHYAQASLGRDKQYRHALWALGMAEEAEGDAAAAERQYRETLARYPDEDRTLASLGHLLARSGRRAEAAEIVARLHAMVAQERRRETFEAIVRTGLGEKDAALALLEQAWENRDANVLNLELEYRLRPLAEEARFQALVRRLREIR